MEKYKNELLEIMEKAKKYDELTFINKDKIMHCSFCGKRQENVMKLIASPKALICDECVELCHEILEEETNEKDNKEYIDAKGIILKDSFTFKIPNQDIVFKAVRIDTGLRIMYDVTWCDAGGTLNSEKYDEADVKDCLAKGSWIEI